MNHELLNLPWATLLTLASGYAGYYIAHHGLRDHHRAIDVTFSTLVFGFISAFPYQILMRSGYDILSSSISAFIITMLVGGAWRKIGSPALSRLLHASRISHADDLPSAWTALFGQTQLNAVTLCVKLKDGTWLMCHDLREFQGRPNGPCVLGAAGDILLYVTHKQPPGAEGFSACNDVTSPEWGDEITYIPAAEVTQIDFRRKVR